MPRPRFATALLALTAPCALLAQTPAPALRTRVDSVFAAFDHTTTPGYAVGVGSAGAPLVRRAYGMANFETATPFSMHTISESGSTAKQFVATALVMLARDGTLLIDDGFRGSTPVTPLFRDGFATGSGERIRFTRDARGRVDGAVLWAGRVRHLRFVRTTRAG